MGVVRKGDYYRYLAEFKTGSERKEAADQSLKAYQVCWMVDAGDVRAELFRLRWVVMLGSPVCGGVGGPAGGSLL